jgi:hypothetical protein
MKNNEQTIRMIGYRPTLLESMKISYISEVFDLNSCELLRELITWHWTLDELNAIAHKINPNQRSTILPYLKRVYSHKKSIEDIIKDGERLYSIEMLGIDESGDWEFINDQKK